MEKSWCDHTVVVWILSCDHLVLLPANTFLFKMHPWESSHRWMKSNNPIRQCVESSRCSWDTGSFLVEWPSPRVAVSNLDFCWLGAFSSKTSPSYWKKYIAPVNLLSHHGHHFFMKARHRLSCGLVGLFFGVSHSHHRQKVAGFFGKAQKISSKAPRRKKHSIEIIKIEASNHLLSFAIDILGCCQCADDDVFPFCCKFQG